eukprot:s1756_g12.t1
MPPGIHGHRFTASALLSRRCESRFKAMPAMLHRVATRSSAMDIAACAKGSARQRGRFPCPDDAAEVLPHQPEVVLSVLHVQLGRLLRSIAAEVPTTCESVRRTQI